MHDAGFDDDRRVFPLLATALLSFRFFSAVCIASFCFRVCVSRVLLCHVNAVVLVVSHCSTRKNDNGAPLAHV